MKLPATIAVCLLPLVLTGCLPHKTTQSQPQKLAPPIEDTPPPKPVPSPTDLPPAVISEPSKPAQQTQQPAQPAEQPAKPPVHHRKTAVKSTQVASNGSAPGVSAIGQLSSGEGSGQRREAEDTILATERGLNGIHRDLSDQEKKTAAQIREFLKQARAALDSGDTDGARTLAAKAKVLLGELAK
jgi:outer membrane biosynthesis protein TonB